MNFEIERLKQAMAEITDQTLNAEECREIARKALGWEDHPSQGMISEIVEKVSNGWGFQGWTVVLPGGGVSGFYYQRHEAISRARMEWPFHEDDLSGQ